MKLTSKGRPATRKGDLDIVHCSVPVRLDHSKNVKVGGRFWSRQGDINHPHLLPGDPCPTHVAPIAIGSPTVRVNGRGAGRVGDKVAGCTWVATGWPTVLIGP